MLRNSKTAPYRSRYGKPSADSKAVRVQRGHKRRLASRLKGFFSTLTLHWILG